VCGVDGEVHVGRVTAGGLGEGLAVDRGDVVEVLAFHGRSELYNPRSDIRYDALARINKQLLVMNHQHN
jgi:hypothetical protein